MGEPFRCRATLRSKTLLLAPSGNSLAWNKFNSPFGQSKPASLAAYDACESSEAFPTCTGEEYRPLPPQKTYTTANEPFFRRIPIFELEEAIPRPLLCKALLGINEETSDDEIVEILLSVDDHDPAKATLLQDMIVCVRKAD